jgi:hypothetical protein
MKIPKIVFLLLITFMMIVSNACNKDSSTPGEELSISSINRMSAMPASQILISGTGFGTDKPLFVRFSDNKEYVMDVPVFQANSNLIIVTVPPFINTRTQDFEQGMVSIRVVVKQSGSEVVSNGQDGFSILDMPVPQAKTGTATLMFIDAQADYLQQLQQDIAGTELETPEFTSSLSASLTNLSALHSKIKQLVNTPGSTGSTFSYGSINGIEINIGMKDLEHTDRYILALFAALASQDLPDPLSGTKSLPSTPCLSGAEMAYNDLLTGTDNSATYNYYNCLITAQPQAVVTASNVVFGAGTFALGVIGLAAVALELPVAAVLALPVAAITFETIMTSGFQITMGANLNNINDIAGRKAIENGVKQINDMMLDMALGAMLSDAAGAVKDVLSGIWSLNEAFSDASLQTDCTYSLSASSIDMPATAGSGNVVMTSTSGCTWTATSGVAWIAITSGASGDGNGTIGFSVVANTSSEVRTGGLQIADKVFTVTQQANAQAGPYDGTWSFTMVGTFTNPAIDPPSWPYPQTTAEMMIVGHDLIGFAEYGLGVLQDDGYAAWTLPSAIMTFSGTFYTTGTGIGTWNYGPDNAGTTAAGTWNATRL